MTDLHLRGRLAAHQHFCWTLGRPGPAGGALEPPRGINPEPLGAEESGTEGRQDGKHTSHHLLKLQEFSRHGTDQRPLEDRW